MVPFCLSRLQQSLRLDTLIQVMVFRVVQEGIIEGNVAARANFILAGSEGCGVCFDSAGNEYNFR